MGITYPKDQERHLQTGSPDTPQREKWGAGMSPGTHTLPSPLRRHRCPVSRQGRSTRWKVLHRRRQLGVGVGGGGGRCQLGVHTHPESEMARQARKDPFSSSSFSSPPNTSYKAQGWAPGGPRGQTCSLGPGYSSHWVKNTPTSLQGWGAVCAVRRVNQTTFVKFMVRTRDPSS